MSERGPRRPPRPTVPPVLWALALTCLVEPAALGALQSCDEARALLVARLSCVLALAVSVTLALVWRNGRGWLATSAAPLLLVVSLLALGSAALCCARQLRVAHELGSGGLAGWELEVATDPSPTRWGYRCRAHARGKGGLAGDVWLQSRERLERGSHLSCAGTFKGLAADDYGVTSWRQGVCGTVSLSRELGTKPAHGAMGALLALRSRVLATIGPDGHESRALVAGCACGYRTSLVAFGLMDEFSACGVAHLVAVSGAHLTLVCALVALLLERIGLEPRLRLLLLALATGLFVLFCGAPVSGLRAWAMSLAAWGAQLQGRRRHASSSVGLVALLMALATPTLPAQLGFALSALSVVGLCLFSPHATYALQCLVPIPTLPRWLGKSRGRDVLSALDGVRSMLAATLVCQLLTLPLVAETFGRISLVAPLSNLLLSPLLMAELFLGLVVGLTWWLPGLCGPVLGACDAVGVLALGILHRLARLPFAWVSVAGLPVSPLAVMVPVLLAWFVAWPRVRPRPVWRAMACALALFATCLVRWRLFAPARIVVLDVGQGDAILVQDRGAAVLVDTGPDASLADALARQHVLHLDAVVMTHLHEDHCGGLGSLVGGVPCERVMVARGVASHVEGELGQVCVALTGKPPAEISYGDTLVVGDFSLRVVWPHDEVDGSDNADSLELAVTYARKGATLSALLTGDAEQDETGACLQAGDVGDIDLLKVGHHGSELSLTASEAAALAPEVSVASAGEGNSYGHPHAACVRTLEEVGSCVLCTKDVGDVDIRPGAKGPIVRKSHRALPELLS